MHLLTVDHFTGCVNEAFVAQLGDGTVDFQLVEARSLPARAPEGFRSPFSLLFRNCAAVVLPQQTYRMRHARLGEVGIFLVPVAMERGGFLYQAVFG